MQRQRQIPAIEKSTWWLAQGEFVTQILRADFLRRRGAAAQRTPSAMTKASDALRMTEEASVGV